MLHFRTEVSKWKLEFVNGTVQVHGVLYTGSLYTNTEFVDVRWAALWMMYAIMQYHLNKPVTTPTTDILSDHATFFYVIS